LKKTSNTKYRQDLMTVQPREKKNQEGPFDVVVKGPSKRTRHLRHERLDMLKSNILWQVLVVLLYAAKSKIHMVIFVEC